MLHELHVCDKVQKLEWTHKESSITSTTLPCISQNLCMSFLFAGDPSIMYVMCMYYVYKVKYKKEQHQKVFTFSLLLPKCICDTASYYKKSYIL